MWLAAIAHWLTGWLPNETWTSIITYIYIYYITLSYIYIYIILYTFKSFYIYIFTYTHRLRQPVTPFGSHSFQGTDGVWSDTWSMETMYLGHLRHTAGICIKHYKTIHTWRFHGNTLWWTNILPWKITIFNRKIHYKWPRSIAMLVHQRVYVAQDSTIFLGHKDGQLFFGGRILMGFLTEVLRGTIYRRWMCQGHKWHLVLASRPPFCGGNLRSNTHFVC